MGGIFDYINQKETTQTTQFLYFPQNEGEKNLKGFFAGNLYTNIRFFMWGGLVFPKNISPKMGVNVWEVFFMMDSVGSRISLGNWFGFEKKCTWGLWKQTIQKRHFFGPKGKPRTAGKIKKQVAHIGRFNLSLAGNYFFFSLGPYWGAGGLEDGGLSFFTIFQKKNA